MTTNLTTPKSLRLATLLVALGGFAAACGGGSSGSGTAAVAQQAAGSGGAKAAGGAAVVETHKGPLGTYLTDSAGRTLYLFAPDKGTTSTCYGTCAKYWPPMHTTGTPKAAGAAVSGKLGTTKRTDGTVQVTYGGHPLYYFAQDTSPGETKGQGLNLNGGLWWAVSPGGTSITTTSTTAPKGGSGGSPSSGGSGGGWG